jgi:uncharacterized membrane protein
MTRKFSVRPVLRIKGRTWKGLRGWAGKPFHPPLTDIPIAAYVIGPVFDVLSWLWRDGDHGNLPTELYRAGTWTLIAGALVSLPTALTGWADWHRSSKVGTQARRTINTHAMMMIVVTLLVLANLALRLNAYDDHTSTPGCLVLIDVLIAGLVFVGATYGGSLVFDYGFNVETSGDHPVWHESETDVFPGDPH